MAELNEILQKLFEACAANVGPLIGVDFDVGACKVAESDEAPEGELAVLNMQISMDDQDLGVLELASPIEDLVPVGRRMLGDDNPDEKRELSADDLDAVGEILNLMSGGVDEVIRTQVNGALRSRPLAFWRTTDPGDNSFASGSMLLARSELGVPGESTIQVFCRLPSSLFETGAAARSTRHTGRVLLLGMPQETAEALGSVLEAARMEVDVLDLDAEHVDEARAEADAIFVAGEPESVFPLCRDLRLANETWRTPVIVCAEEARRGFVQSAIEHGASHVLIVPASDTEVLRVLNLAKPPEQ